MAFISTKRLERRIKLELERIYDETEKSCRMGNIIDHSVEVAAEAQATINLIKAKEHEIASLRSEIRFLKEAR